MPFQSLVEASLSAFARRVGRVISLNLPVIRAELIRCDHNQSAPVCPVTGLVRIRPGTTLTPRTGAEGSNDDG
jgi:hypothetical protein